MAIYIPIEKVGREGGWVIYSYRAGSHDGLVQIEETTGEIQELQRTPDSKAEEWLARVIYKLSKHWQRGTLPDKTSWSA